jgi:hypothetical protein
MTVLEQSVFSHLAPYNVSIPSYQKPSKTFMLRSGEVETVKVHDFVPHHYKVVQELLL